MFGSLGMPELIILLLVVAVAASVFKLPRILMKMAAATAGGPVDASGQSGKIVLGIGVLLLIFGAIRWNSAASQLSRAFGGSDGLGVLLFIGGGIAVWIGYKMLPSAASSPRTTAHVSGRQWRTGSANLTRFDPKN